MKIVTVIGARPQFIKAATVSRAIATHNANCRSSLIADRSSNNDRHSTIKEIIVHTGQHYDQNMSDVFFEELEIPRPDYNLEIHSGNHGAQTGRMLEKIEAVLLDERPDWVVVYGDTNSTLAGALAAAKLHVPVAHVEAGLRSFNRRMPEEVNRILTDHLSDLLFAPTELAVTNLRDEGMPQGRIRMVGDVMYDAALYYGQKAEQKSSILKTLGVRNGKYVLSTIHRAENTDNPHRLKAIAEGLCKVASIREVVLPLHPRTRKALQAQGLFDQVRSCMIVIEPVGYLDMVMLERHAHLIVTDSGGIQKEAFFSRVPCLTLRDETEWVELVELGWNRIVPPVSAVDIFNAAVVAGKGGDVPPEMYGTGCSALLICSELLGKCYGTG